MAILTTTTLDVQASTVAASVLIIVQTSAINTTVNMTEAELLAQAATQGRTDWDTSDVCALCAAAIGLPVTTT